MSRVIDQELSRKFGEAKRSLMCLHGSGTRLRRALERRVQAGSVVSPHHSLYARTEYWETLKPDEQALHIIRALQQAHPTWAFCCQSAGLVWGLPISYRDVVPIHVMSGSHQQLKQQGIVLHTLHNAPVQTVRGVRVTGLVRTVFDCLRAATFIDGLALADRALRMHEPGRRRAFRRELQSLARGHGCAPCDGHYGLRQSEERELGRIRGAGAHHHEGLCPAKIAGAIRAAAESGAHLLRRHAVYARGR